MGTKNGGMTIQQKQQWCRICIYLVGIFTQPKDLQPRSLHFTAEPLQGGTYKKPVKFFSKISESLQVSLKPLLSSISSENKSTSHWASYQIQIP